MAVKNNFGGFTGETIKFLSDLARNNKKTWFDANKDRYQEHLLKPFVDLAADLAPVMSKIDGRIIVTPAVNKTISRIYRDTRFSKDKSPYKTKMWLAYKRPGKDWADAPAFYFEISADGYRYGMGMYAPEKATMDALRGTMAANPAAFRKAVSFYKKQKEFVVAGEEYKRPLNNEVPAEFAEWSQRKNLYLVCERKPSERLFSKNLFDDLKNGFQLLAPFYNFLWSIKGEARD
jgi:uncharacterized protein (TIGR02453 family)